MTEKESFFQHLKVINKIYKPNTAAYLMLVIDKHKYWASHQDHFYKLTNRSFTGHFYIARSTFEKEINLKRGAQNTAEETLKADGVISMKDAKGKANWYTVNHKMLMEKIDNYFLDQEEQEVFIDYPFDESEEYEEWIFQDIENTSDQYEEEQQGTLLKTDNLPCEKGAATNNKRIILNNKNKVSNATYVPDRTYSVNQDLDCIKNTQDSCIKKKTEGSPRRAHTPTANDKEIYEIINQYNKAMGYELAKGDYEAVRDNLEDYRKLKPYFTTLGLKFAWKTFPDEGAKKKLDKPRIATIVSYKLMETFLKRKEEISSYCMDVIDIKLDKVFQKFRVFLNTIDPKKYQVNIVGGLCMYGSPDSLWGKGHREERYKLYKEYIEPKLLQDEDLYDMIIEEV